MSEHAGAKWGELRKSLGLSREKFAEQTGLTPGAIWRIEAKGNLKPGELEKLEAFVANKELDPIPKPVIADSPGDVLVLGGNIGAYVPISEPIHSAEGVEWHHDKTPLTGVTSTNLSVVTPLTEDAATHLVNIINENFLVTEPAVLNEPNVTPYEAFLKDGVRRYTNSEIQTFKRCRRKWYLGYYLQWQPKYESPVGARAIGDRIHRALRWHYHEIPALRRDPSDALELLIKMDLAVLTKHYAPELIPLSILDKFEKDADLERVMIKGYVEWLAETGADSELEIIGSERYVETLTYVGDTPVFLVARLDAKVRRTTDNARMFIDHKSVGDLTTPIKTLSINEQMLWYLMIEHQMAGEEKVGGAIYNMLRRSKRTPKATPPFYQRVEVRHNPTMIANFQTRTVGTIREIERVRAALDAGADHREIAFPTPSPDCSWSCNFLPVENLIDDGSHWEEMMKAFYKQGDPSAYYRNASDITVS